MRLSFITDEVTDDLDDAIAFAHAHAIDAVELRSVGGKNLMRMSDAEIDAIVRALRAADLGVVGFASPLLKWACRPDPAATSGVRTHGYELPAGASPEDVCRRGFEIARRLGAPRIRVFSYLRAPRPSHDELAAAMTMIEALSDELGIAPVLEHEKVCHVANVAEVTEFLAAFPRMRLLLDPGNFAEGGEWITEVPATWRVGHVHVKDYDGTTFVPVGKGRVDFARILAGLPEDVVVSMETHCPHDRAGATAGSLAVLRATVMASAQRAAISASRGPT